MQAILYNSTTNHSFTMYLLHLSTI